MLLVSFRKNLQTNYTL